MSHRLGVKVNDQSQNPDSLSFHISYSDPSALVWLDVEALDPNQLVPNNSHGLGPGEQTGVDGVNDRLCANLPTAKVPPVEALDGVFATRHPLKF